MLPKWPSNLPLIYKNISNIASNIRWTKTVSQTNPLYHRIIDNSPLRAIKTGFNL